MKMSVNLMKRRSVFLPYDAENIPAKVPMDADSATTNAENSMSVAMEASINGKIGSR